MEIGRAQNSMGMAAMMDQGVGMPDSPSLGDREQAMKNAMNQLQSRYGEKQKEARPVKKQLDKDDFMRIMITEMKHQDPTKPMDSDRMATQMAQVTSVEQLKNVSNAIEKLSEKSNSSDRLAMSGMIGKEVTVDKSRFVHQKGMESSVSFDLPEDAQKIKLTIMNEKGEEVASRELEPMKAGSNVYNWDGINGSNVQSNSGTYMVRVEAENTKGSKIKVNPISKETIMGISFEGGETNFLVGDSKNPQKIGFRNVTRIESGSGGRASAAEGVTKAVSNRAPAEASEKAGGLESGDGLPPGRQEKLKTELAQAKPEETQATLEPAPKAEGFPNGLQE
jgi:flagellar basal-body rod modification protein FlgD